MSDQTINLSPDLYNYLKRVSLREPDVLKKLRVETHKLKGAIMQISAEQGQFMALLVELMGAKKTLDLGTFTGYSALVVAMALPMEGRVITCDLDRESTKIAKSFWELAGFSHKIHLHLGFALNILQGFLDNNEKNTFDFVFIDADKTNYINYYEKSLDLLRPGGLMMIDNVLQGGKVADPYAQEKSTQTIRALNEKILHDERVTLSMIPIGDGLTLVRKK